jgi:hypothetical protein
MKIITTTLVALLATASVAFATDLPSKKKAPAAAAPATATEAVAAASTDSLKVEYGQDLGTNFGAKVDDAYTVTYKHSIGGGFAIGGMAQTTQVPGSQLNQNLELQGSYALPAMYGVTLTGKASLGEKFSSTNFAYYALYGNADYKVNDNITLNAVGYRFRSAVDSNTYGYQSHQLSTGVTFDINKSYSLNAKVARNYDTGWNATGDAFTVGATVKF